MAFVDQSVEIITEPDLFKRIEIAARTCYKSEDKITEGSAEKMVKNLLKRGHGSPLEHSCIVVRGKDDYFLNSLLTPLIKYEVMSGLPSFIRISIEEAIIASANLRAWRSLLKWVMDWYPDEPILALFRGHRGFDDILPGEKSSVLIVNPDDISDRHRLITARFICDRAVSHELVRHRMMSYSQQSQRYVRYENGVDCVKPHWFDDEDSLTLEVQAGLVADSYQYLLGKGYPPQDARCVLPNMTQTEIVVSGTAEQWKKYVLPLRLNKAAHPDIRHLMELFCQQLGWDPDAFRE